jgi:pyrroloquinoline quinone (PQQ) biosynthesis protein C
MCIRGIIPMTQIRQWVDQIRLDLMPVEKQILGHRYLKALEQGRAQRDQLKLFAGQQYHIISSDLRSIALIVSRQGMLPSRPFLMNVLQGEAAALDALHRFASALGVEVKDLELVEPLPSAHTYCAFVAWLALYGSDAELAGAFLVNFPAWGSNCRRMSEALHKKYDLSSSALTFFDLFANMPSFEQEALVIIQNGLDRGIPKRLIHRAARLLQSYELMYWDAIADAGGISLVEGG